MIDKTRAVVSINKSRHKFVEFIYNNTPATVDVNMLLDRISFESLDIDCFDDEEMSYLNLLSYLLYEFFIEDYKELEEYIYVDESELYHFFPVGHATRAYFINFDFENEKNVRMLKLKHPRLMKRLGL